MTEPLGPHPAGLGSWKDALAEVERLRGRLAEIEWAGETGNCPACGGCSCHGGHEPDCWLDAEIRRGE